MPPKIDIILKHNGSISASTSHTRLVLQRGYRSGFTLFEMVMVMFIVSLLITAVFSIVNSVTQLTHDMATEQQKDARTHSFIELCARTFRNLPPSAVVRLRNQQISGRTVSQLVLIGATSPLTGDSGGVTLLQTGATPDGYLQVLMQFMSLNQIASLDKEDKETGISVPLLENVALMEWKFFYPQSGEWEPLWNDKLDFSNLAANTSSPGALTTTIPIRRPSLIELRLGLGTEPVQRFLFWVPPSIPINAIKPDQDAPKPDPNAPPPASGL